MSSLFVLSGPDQGIRYDLVKSETTVGRDPTNTVQLHDNEISRHHAEIRFDGISHSLADLGSSNGTFVNGNRIDFVSLNTGDNVQIGKTVLLYTGPAHSTRSDLASNVNIVARSPQDDGSRIIRTLPQPDASWLKVGDLDAMPNSWMERARGNLQIMYRTALAVSHTMDIDQLLQRILQLIFDWVECDRGCMMLMNPDSGQLEPRAWYSRGGRKTSEKLTISKTILDYVMDHNEGVLTSDAREDVRWDSAASIVSLGVREAICVPMRGRYHQVGAIYIDTSQPAPPPGSKPSQPKFQDEHLKLMIAIAHQAALAVEDTRYYSALVQAERLAAVGQAIAMLSHHVKNILQGIRGGSFLIKEGIAQHDETLISRGWEFVEKNQERISHLVMDMLTFSKEREPDLGPANLDKVLRDILELMATRAKDKGVELTYHPAEYLAESLVFDAEGMHRAVLNLITNAIDAADPKERDLGEEGAVPQKGIVDLSVHYLPEAGLVSIVVEDNGLGIAQEEVEGVFSLFASNKGNRGTGLGLPVSQKIVKEHGGQIKVESTLGKGTRFIVEIPAVIPAAVTQCKTS